MEIQNIYSALSETPQIPRDCNWLAQHQNNDPERLVRHHEAQRHVGPDRTAQRSRNDVFWTMILGDGSLRRGLGLKTWVGAKQQVTHAK